MKSVVLLVVLLSISFAYGSSVTVVKAENVSSVEDPCSKGTTEEKIDCLIRMMKQIKGALEPIQEPPIEQWPGNTICVECNLFTGIVIGSLETAFLYFLITSLAGVIFANNNHFLQTPFELVILQKKQTRTQKLFWAIGVLLSIVGWGYYSLIVATYWNFVSYLMLAGLGFVFPGIILVRTTLPRSPFRDQLISRRLKLGGWLLGAVTLALFTNVPLIPSQVQRHLYPSDLIITPDDPQVQILRGEFFSEITPAKFYSLAFDDQMNVVDNFIYRKINWREDYGAWKMVGLLLSPNEVISQRYGDCQGQAAVTTSLLLSLGIQAYMVETPFHWWTHAVDNATGKVHDLNSHGHGGDQGNVLPQPIDQVFTRPPLACSNCPYIMSHNVNPNYYMAPPHRAIAIAFTGAHILVRSGLTLKEVSFLQLTLMGIAMGVLVSLCASYSQGDFVPRAVLKRLAFSAPVGVFILFGMSFWATVLYQVSILHLLFTISFLFAFISSDQFNLMIGEHIFQRMKPCFSPV